MNQTFEHIWNVKSFAKELAGEWAVIMLFAFHGFQDSNNIITFQHPNQFDSQTNHPENNDINCDLSKSKLEHY